MPGIAGRIQMVSGWRLTKPTHCSQGISLDDSLSNGTATAGLLTHLYYSS